MIRLTPWDWSNSGVTCLQWTDEIRSSTRKNAIQYNVSPLQYASLKRGERYAVAGPISDSNENQNYTQAIPRHDPDHLVLGESQYPAMSRQAMSDKHLPSVSIFELRFALSICECTIVYQCACIPCASLPQLLFLFQSSDYTQLAVSISFKPRIRAI